MRKEATTAAGFAGRVQAADGTLHRVSQSQSPQYLYEPVQHPIGAEACLQQLHEAVEGLYHSEEADGGARAKACSVSIDGLSLAETLVANTAADGVAAMQNAAHLLLQAASQLESQRAQLLEHIQASKISTQAQMQLAHLVSAVPAGVQRDAMLSQLENRVSLQQKLDVAIQSVHHVASVTAQANGIQEATHNVCGADVSCPSELASLSLSPLSHNPNADYTDEPVPQGLIASHCCVSMCLCSHCVSHCVAAVYLSLHTHIHSLSRVLVVMMKSKELKTKIYSHAHSLILSHCVCDEACAVQVHRSELIHLLFPLDSVP